MAEDLAQQQLLEPPPARRIITFSGTAHWGVDVSTRGVSIAYLSPDVRGVRTVLFPKLDGGQQLATIHRETRELARQIAGKSLGHAPGIILVEQPSGAQPNPALSYAVGVAQAAIYEGVLNATGHPPLLETCASSWWKKQACGHGGIKKPKRKSDGEYPVLEWARLNGYPGSSWDEADALGIAEAARRTIALENRS